MKLHSVVDVITNSSSSVYVWPTGLEPAKEFFQSILSAIIPNAKVEDYFEFYYTLDSDIMDYNEEVAPVFERYLESIKMSKEEYDKLDYKEEEVHYDKIIDMILELYLDGEFPFLDGYNEDSGYHYSCMLNVMVKPINAEAFSLQRSFNSLFDYTTGYG